MRISDWSSDVCSSDRFDQLDEQEITFPLRRYPVDEGRAIPQRFRDSGTVGDDTDVVAGILRESVLDWSGVPAADGGEVPFSGDALAGLLHGRDRQGGEWGQGGDVRVGFGG